MGKFYICCRVGDSNLLYRAIQEEIFLAGGEWHGSDRHIDNKVYDDAVLYWDEKGKSLSHGSFENINYANTDLVEIPVFLAKIKEQLSKKQYKIKLTEDYSAEWAEGDSIVNVGCQKIPTSAILEIAEILKK